MRRAAGIRPLPLVIVLAVSLATATAAHACTMCDSPTAKIVRDRVFTAGFLGDVAELALVFPLLLGAVALAGRDRQHRGSKSHRKAP